MNNTLPISNAFKIEGLRIGLTGGGGNLGSAIALQALALGAKVLICGRSEESLQKVKITASGMNLPGTLITRQADISSDDQVAGLLDLMIEKWQGIDGWINNASAATMSNLLSLDRKAVEETVYSELVNVMMATDAVAKRMIGANQPGSIVNIASMYGLVSPQPDTYCDYPQYHNPPAYGAAKAGIIQFTRYAACHYGSHQIRVNAVSPGPFPKEEIRKEKGFVEELEKRVPLQRIGRPEEVALPVLFLLSSAAGYINGHNLVVDGGWTAW